MAGPRCGIMAALLITAWAASESPAQDDQKALLHVILPAPRTRLEIQGQALKVTEATRRVFESPPLRPGAVFIYDLKAVWTENGVEKTRERSVKVQAGKTTEIDLRLEVDNSPHIAPPPVKPADEKPAEPGEKSFVAPPPAVVETMLKVAGVGEMDVVHDLGCGDGRIAIAAVTAAKARKAVGYDANAARLAAARTAAAAIADRVAFREKDPAQLTPEDLAEATVVILSTTTPERLAKLAPLLQKLKSGTRIIVHEFEIPGMKHDEVRELQVDRLDHLIYRYTVK